MITTLILLLTTLPTFCAATPAPRHPELQLFENNYCATQRIDCGQSHGTGVNINRDGYILTNDHVATGNREGACKTAEEWKKACEACKAAGNQENACRPCKAAEDTKKSCDEAKNCQIVVSIDSGSIDTDLLPRVTTYVATIVARDPKADLAVIKIDSRSRFFVSLVDVDWTSVQEKNDLCVGDYANGSGYCAGQDIYSIGFPLQLGIVISRGSINKLYAGMEMRDSNGSGKTVQLFEHELVFTPEPGGPGTSGSAVFLKNSGQFVGLAAKEISVLANGLPVKFHTAVALDRIVAFLDANGIAYSTDAFQDPEKKLLKSMTGKRPKRGAIRK